MSADVSTDRIAVFLVEDQAPILKGLVKLLSSWPEIEVVGSAMSGESALAHLPSSGARVALVDIELPGMDGIELVGELRRRDASCELLMLTSFVDEQKVFQAMRQGASGYLVKNGPAERLRAAISTVDAGGTVIEPRLAKLFWAYFRGEQAPPRQGPLDEAELELLHLVAKGLTNAETASVLGVPTRSLRTRLQKIYAKLGVNSHVAAVVEGLRRGILRV